MKYITKDTSQSTTIENVSEIMQQSLINNGNCINLVTVDDVDFEAIHGNCIRLITIDGTKPAKEIAHKTLIAVEQWLENRCDK